MAAHFGQDDHPQVEVASRRTTSLDPGMWTKIRLRSVWAMVPVYLVFARPSLALMLIGLLLGLGGLAIRGWAASSIRKNRVLTTHGPYAYTRNPLYLGSFLIGIGFGIASGVWWILALFFLFFVTVYGRTMQKEERRLAGLFGVEFDRYAVAVPRFLPKPAAWTDVTGETSPARPPAAELAVLEPSDARRPKADERQKSVVRRYLSTREYQALLGVLLMYLALLAKLVL